MAALPVIFLILESCLLCSNACENEKNSFCLNQVMLISINGKTVTIIIFSINLYIDRAGKYTDRFI